MKPWRSILCSLIKKNILSIMGIWLQMPIIYLKISKRYYYTKIVLLSRCTNSLNRTFHFISLLWVQRQCHINTYICGLDCESADNNSIKKHQEILCFLADCYHGTNYAHVLHRFYCIHGKSREKHGIISLQRRCKKHHQN